ncbi:MAG: hypothetical protein ACYCZO_16965, partial [Daejeonella sp.]
MGIAEQLNAVVDKTSRLIDLCMALQEENDLLKRESESQKKAILSSDSKNKDLEERVRVLTLARSLEGVHSAPEG